MRPTVLHSLLAFLILIQSVSALAVMPVGSLVSDESAEIVLDSADMADMDMAHHGAEGSCHSQVVDTNTEKPHTCCDSMNGANCLINCFSAAATLSTSNLLVSPHEHERYSVVVYYSIPHKVVSGLFRPPRIS